MENIEKLEPQEIQIQGLIDRYLKAKTANNLQVEAQHLDEDSLAAFIEGNLNERESKPIVSHLVDCSFCRHITVELVRLDLAFAGEEIQPAFAQSEQPSKISEVLNGLLSRLFGSNENAVFAHHETKEKEEETKEKEQEKS